MDQLVPIASRVLGVFLIMIAGAACRRVGWLSAQADRSLANLTANVLLPCLFFDRVLNGPQLESLASSWFPPLVGFLFTAAGFGIAGLFAWRCGPAIGLKTAAHRRAFTLCVGICNYGYIPIPLAQQFFPEAEVTLIVHNVGVDLALWSLGVLVIAGTVGTNWRRILVSPPLVAVVLALLFRQLGGAERLPTPLLHLTHSLGECSIPMGLLLSGAIIIDFLPRLRLHEGKAILASASLLRLGLLPAAMLMLARFGLERPEMQQVLLLQAAMPAATFPIVLVRLYEQDLGTALQVVLGTSLMAIVTIPLWLLIGAQFLGFAVAG